jgi:hypothetical protein
LNAEATNVLRWLSDILCLSSETLPRHTSLSVTMSGRRSWMTAAAAATDRPE